MRTIRLPVRGVLLAGIVLGVAIMFLSENVRPPIGDVSKEERERIAKGFIPVAMRTHRNAAAVVLAGAAVSASSAIALYLLARRERTLPAHGE